MNAASERFDGDGGAPGNVIRHFPDNGALRVFHIFRPAAVRTGDAGDRVHIAQIIAAAFAEITFVTGDDNFHDGFIADFETIFFFGTLAQFHHFADKLMSGNDGGMVVDRLAEIGVTVENLRIGGADTNPADLDYYFFFTGLRVGDIFITKITFSMNDNSFHLLPLCFDQLLDFFFDLFLDFKTAWLGWIRRQFHQKAKINNTVMTAAAISEYSRSRLRVVVPIKSEGCLTRS